QRIAAAFERNESPAALLNPDEGKLVRSFQLLTLKPELALWNVGDDRLNQPPPADLLALSPAALAAPATLEMELHDLGQECRQAFMQDLGLKGFVRDDVLRKIFAAMGQQVFFTVGEDECRAWPMPKGADAVIAAGQIHTDLARGFVRARVISYADFEKYGSE